ncbi:glycosyltransferase family 4 protein [Aeromicrobium sp.]|uniref:glycosyltransferase family 4 protein n=1 Tax=Aeromicrobium sp. TaxID=1871063 RepID=UPI0028B187C4|nr:glycosyltransferase family 4 protein [Aeromicrobium sp.]
MSRPRRVTLAHPSSELYGSDLQLAETAGAFATAGHEVTVVLPQDGPLVEVLRARGARTVVTDFPVLRKAFLNPRGLVRLAAATLRTLPALWRHVGAADVVWVNTITVPGWLAVARLRGRDAVCHVHEAEDEGHRLVRTALALPLVLARRIVCNSAAARHSLTAVVPALGRRTTVVHNGVEGPTEGATALPVRIPGDPARIAMIGRFSPRKGTDVALEAVARLRAEGRDVSLGLCGSTFEGYEWFEQDLRKRSAQPDLAGSVEFLGFVRPVWSVLAGADVVLVPSRVEPFGNTAVEALLAERPLVASRTQGLREIVEDGVTGLHAEPGDADSLATAIARLLDDPALARRLAETGGREARRRFSTEAYGRAVTEVLSPRP